MLYFAYGSNMEWKQMRERCPSAMFVCIAKLKDRRLAFTRKSKDRGCGVATLCLSRVVTYGVWCLRLMSEMLAISTRKRDTFLAAVGTLTRALNAMCMRMVMSKNLL